MLRGASVALAASSGDRSIKVVDFETGTTFFSFADTVPHKNGIIVLGGRASLDGLGGAGDYVVSSQVKEQALVFHKWGKTQPVFKCKVPEHIGPVCCTPDGLFVVAGGSSGALYVWEAATGSLIKSWEGHFKAVSALGVTQDGSMLVSGSDDTLVRVWSMGQAVDSDVTEGLRPLRSWSGHSLPVTSVVVGMGGLGCRVVSASLDQTAQLHDLLSPSALHTLRCPQGLTAAAMDAAERRLVLGGLAGTVFVVDLDVVAMAKTAARAAAVVVGAGAKALLGAANGPGAEGGAVRQERLNELVGHNKAVTALSFSWDGRLLISASEDGSLRTWDLESHQCIRRLNMEAAGSVHAAILVPRPRALTQPPPAKAVLCPLQPFKKHRVVEAGRPGQGQGSSAAAAGSVLLVGGTAGRRRVASALVDSLSPSTSLRSSGSTAEPTAQDEEASAPAEASMETEEPAEERATEPDVTAESAASRKKKKRRRGSQGPEAAEVGETGDRRLSSKEKASWEQVRTQLETELERLKGENEQWQELANGLWGRLGAGGDEGDEGGDMKE